MDKENLKREEYNYDQNPELLALAKKGDNDAMNKLIEINLPLVTSISKKFLNRGYEYEDIRQKHNQVQMQKVLDERFEYE